MPLYLPPLHFGRIFTSSKSQGSSKGNRHYQAPHGKINHSNVVGDCSLEKASMREHSLSRAQAIHREDMALARAPVEYIAQKFPIPKRPRFFGEATAVQDPECIFLPRPSLQLSLQSGLGERRRHHDRNPCGLCIYLKPTLLSRNLPFNYSREWEIEEVRQTIMFAQHRSRGRATGPEPQNGTFEAAEAQVQAQLKSPNQSRIPEEQLIMARERSFRLVRNGRYTEPTHLFTTKEKMGLRLLRREIAKFPRIRDDALVVCPEMEHHPFYCSNEQLDILGIDSSWGIADVMEAAPPAPVPATAPAPALEQDRYPSSPKYDDAFAYPGDSVEDLGAKDDAYIDSLQPVSGVDQQDLSARTREFRSLYDELEEQSTGKDSPELCSINGDHEQRGSDNDHHDVEGELRSPDDDDRDVFLEEY